MKKCVYLIAMLVCLAGFSSCRNTDRQIQLLVDMWTGAGEFKGYATVYEHDMDEEEYVQESFGNALLRYKFYNYYIEDIPHSY